MSHSPTSTEKTPGSSGIDPTQHVRVVPESVTEVLQKSGADDISTEKSAATFGIPDATVAGSDAPASHPHGPPRAEGVTHTPGPWHVGVGGFIHANRVWTEDMRPIVNLCSMGIAPADIDQEAQANGRLIAAAPDLLLELKSLVAAYGNTTWGTVYAMERALPSARRVIARVEGTDQ